jgi:predicted DNA-binding transcriptional regulator AlpA
MTQTALDDLVTGAEAARRLGVSRERLRQLSIREDFPSPLGTLGRANVWRDTEIAEWAAAHERDYTQPEAP